MAFDPARYHMGFQQPVAPQRLAGFIEGTLDANEIAVLMQDVIEAGLLPTLSSQFFFCAQHCVEQGLCTVTGRMLQ